MNANENRGLIEIKDVFDKKGNFKEGGEELLVRKLTGYVSFVRGENPYIFPFRVYPNYFSPKDTFFENPDLAYPLYQMNGKKINQDDILRFTSIYLTKIGDYQSTVYSYIIEYLKNKNRKTIDVLGSARELSAFESMESFGYTLLQMPIEALNIVYPIENLTENENPLKMMGGEGETSQQTSEQSSEQTNEQSSEQSSEQTSEDNSETITTQIDPHSMIGKTGLERMMDFVDTKMPLEKGKFEYKEETISQYGRIFSLDNIGKYSSKIKNICDTVLKSDGVILIYSQYIDAGLIPMALALEEMGFTRYGSNSLFKTPPSEPLDLPSGGGTAGSAQPLPAIPRGTRRFSTFLLELRRKHMSGRRPLRHERIDWFRRQASSCGRQAVLVLSERRTSLR
jgi:hypothetical protein